MIQPPVLRVEDLRVDYSTANGPLHAVRGVTFELAPRQALGVVGESGSGKSTLAFALMGYLPGAARISSGRVLFRGRDIATLSAAELRALRGSRMAMVYQDPASALNPTLRVGEQIAEVLRTHQRLSRPAASEQVVALLEQVNLPDPGGAARRYPHELSGGQQQRVVIAMALACNPDLLILDEPTTGLDVTTEARILDLIEDLRTNLDAAVLFISHNLGVVGRVCDAIAVMYAGEVVELGSSATVLGHPSHPYTAGLLAAIPRVDRPRREPLQVIPGRLPDLRAAVEGCVYAPRCSFAQSRCWAEAPRLDPIAQGHLAACHFAAEVANGAPDAKQAPTAGRAPSTRAEPVLEVNALSKAYRIDSGLPLGPRRAVRALNGVSLGLGQGETLAVVGESGCGKTTLARCVVGLLDPSAGRIALLGRTLARRRSPLDRRQLQIVFQNPDDTLNPRQTVGNAIGRPVELFAGLRGDARRARVLDLLRAVRLGPEYVDRYPVQLSGGERQRVGIARAFAAGARVVVCDEPTSALDMSVQAAVLNLLETLQRENTEAYLFISHDLGVVRHLAHHVMILYLGEVMEIGAAEQVFQPPYHPYTEALLSAVPIPDPAVRNERIRLMGAVPDPSRPPPGCPFQTRCPRKLGAICEEQAAPLREVTPGHSIRCHIPVADLQAAQNPPFGERLAPVSPSEFVNEE